MADMNDKKTLVDDGTELKGTINSKVPVVVRGSVDGELSAPSLKVSDSGSVSGKVRVAELHSEGQLAGEFDAEVVRLSGKVKDGAIIRARTLEVLAPTDNGMRVVFGDAVLEVGDIAPPEKDSSPAVAARGRKNRE
jgi:cytoskeletal protein CcmA (bactofilin family)